MKIVSASDIKKSSGVKIAVHGAAGMGKTMLAATCRKPLVILTEETGADSLGKENILRVFPDEKLITTDIDFLPAYTPSKFKEATEIALKSEYETIIFDSISEACKLLLSDEKANYTNQMQAYGKMAEKIDILLRTLRSSEKNIVLLFHSKRVEDSYNEEGGSVVTYVPGFEGRVMTDEFPYLFGDVYCLVNEFDDEGNEVRRLRTRQGDTLYFAKCRSGVLPELCPPHIGKIIKKLR